VSSSGNNSLLIKVPEDCAEITCFYIGFEVFTAVTMKNAIIADVTPFGSL
jgi:hypothetical protein